MKGSGIGEKNLKLINIFLYLKLFFLSISYWILLSESLRIQALSHIFVIYILSWKTLSVCLTSAIKYECLPYFHSKLQFLVSNCLLHSWKMFK